MPAFVPPWIVQIHFLIGGADDVPGALQANPGRQAGAVMQAEPVAVGQGDDSLADRVAFDLVPVATDVQFEGILEHDGKQSGRGVAAGYRAFETGR